MIPTRNLSFNKLFFNKKNFPSKNNITKILLSSFSIFSLNYLITTDFKNSLKNKFFGQKLLALKNDENYEINNKTTPEFFFEIDKKELTEKYPNLTILDLKSIDLLVSQMRDKKISMQEFRFLSKRLVRIIMEEVIALDHTEPIVKESPLGLYNSKAKRFDFKDYVAISILRSGNAMIDELINIFPEISIGNVMIQRDENSVDKKPKFYFEKIPKNIKGKRLLVLDPMLATGGSAAKTIEIIVDKGANEEDITFVNIIGCEEGIKNLTNKFPKMKIICAKVDPVLLPNKYLAPGIGDFGDRYYGTVN